MKEQHRIETPEQRHHRGAKRAAILEPCAADYAYVAEVERKLTSSEKAKFRGLYFEARRDAGVRPAADLALSALMASWTDGLVKPSWRRT